MAESVTIINEVPVRGLREIDKRLKAFPAKIQRAALNKALRAGAQLIVKEAKATAPVDTGATRRNIIAKVARDKKGRAARMIIGVRHGRVRTQETKIRVRGKERIRKLTAYDRRGEDPFYWRFVELGTSRIAGRHFLTKAFDSQSQVALEKFRSTLAAEIEKLAKDPA